MNVIKLLADSAVKDQNFQKSPSKNYENVYYSFGHHHLGWTLGAISGKIVSGMIANENTNMDLKPYSSVRFA